MYVYEDSNLGGFRIPHVYLRASATFEFRRNYANQPKQYKASYGTSILDSFWIIFTMSVLNFFRGQLSVVVL